MLDLDDFRNVNNDLGHQAGDALLRRIAAALVRAGRDTDLVFRYGGDEFTFLLPEHRRGRRAARRRAGAAGRAAPTDGAITASVGVATFPQDGATATDVLLAADRACYVAKRGGRDRDRDRRRGPRPGRRAVAPGADAGRLGEPPGD